MKAVIWYEVRGLLGMYLFKVDVEVAEQVCFCNYRSITLRMCEALIQQALLTPAPFTCVLCTIISILPNPQILFAMLILIWENKYLAELRRSLLFRITRRDDRNTDRFWLGQKSRLASEREQSDSTGLDQQT